MTPEEYAHKIILSLALTGAAAAITGAADDVEVHSFDNLLALDYLTPSDVAEIKAEGIRIMRQAAAAIDEAAVRIAP